MFQLMDIIIITTIGAGFGMALVYWDEICKWIDEHTKTAVYVQHTSLSLEGHNMPYVYGDARTKQLARNRVVNYAITEMLHSRGFFAKSDRKEWLAKKITNYQRRAVVSSVPLILSNAGAVDMQPVAPQGASYYKFELEWNKKDKNWKMFICKRVI